MVSTVAATAAFTLEGPAAASMFAVGSWLPALWCFGVAALLSVVLSADIFGDVMTTVRRVVAVAAVFCDPRMTPEERERERLTSVSRLHKPYKRHAEPMCPGEG